MRLALATCFCIWGSWGTAAFAEPSESGERKEKNRETQRELAIIDRYNVPIAELSGLAIGRTVEDRREEAGAVGISLYAIGDASYDIANLRINSSSGKITLSVDDAAAVLGKRTASASQWEAIATDSLDTICMLSETRSEVSCLDRNLRNDLGTFKLDVSSIKRLDRVWQDRPNSRGEGMILMKKGHVLILKEKQPSMLIEFGPEGDSPLGYGPDTFLEHGEAFIIPQSRHWVALKTWEFSGHLAALARDASEITLGPDGRVYLLSQESSTLIRLERTLKPHEDVVSVDHDTYWKLPAGIEKAEGLVIDSTMHPWIGIDIKQKDKLNLFRLSPVDPAAQ
ncbi:SdiA-regulated domain-containing protein [Nitrosovibrio tenuis]|uniref:SdiA-regulated n=1 Tax=Nitrosovibrio tenuis TaxID=1233 RepID=A0A1H7NJ99_9PROT|nr:SdiA-regulated domain-containing protein [Nitrosovibrio tenuis]SEL23095.1 SdiA-regulated [Nitrosovibrio tenuis]